VPNIIESVMEGGRMSVDERTTTVESTTDEEHGWSTVHGRVDAVRRITPTLVQVTLAGFHGYPLVGGDEFVYAMVSHAPGGVAPDYGIDDVRAARADDPVRGAYYTVRRSRPERGEIDIWAVVHGHEGSVSAWMAAAEPGAPVALWGPRRGYQLPPDARHVLFVADESGLAAVAALVDGLTPDRRATAVLECVDADHRPPMPDHRGLTVHWVDRGADEPGAVNHLLAAVVEHVPAGPDTAFGAAESHHISAVRRQVQATLGIASSRVLMTGYWRRRAA
jgi:NADPH-dependent ferric siderophore reductase